MKLLYITNGINGAGGLERVLSVKASYLADQYNYEVIILSLNGNDQHPFYDFSKKVKMLSIAVGGNVIQYIKSYRKGIKKTVKDLNPDIISVCDDGLKGFFIPSILGNKIPVIFERHVSKQIEMRPDFSWFKKIAIQAKWLLMEKLAANFSKFVVLTNGNLREWPSLKNMTVIPNPLSFYPEKSSTLKNKKVIAVGKQGFQKGYDLLLPCWQLVQQQHPDWQLNIYGKIVPSAKLQEQADDLNIDKTVFFYPPEKAIESKYLESSIYVMSSRFEGFGMVLIEAMACGLPCVAFDCNYGPADIIQNGVDGYLVANGDTTALALRINELIANEELRIKLGKNAKENAKHFSPEIIVEQWDDLFKQLLP